MPGFPLCRPSQTPPLLHPAPAAPPHSHSSSLQPLPHPPPHPLPAFHANSSMIPAQTSAQPILSKQVTDPLPGTSRARRIHAASAMNYSSSGSAHDPTSLCLAEMVHEFLEEEGHVGSCGRARCNCLSGTCSGEGRPSSEADESLLPREQLSEILEGLVSCTSSDEPNLLANVAEEIESEIGKHLEAVVKEYGNTADRGCLRRPVMKHLRQVGYNAAICKTRWNHADGIPAGDYEFIDVLMDGDSVKRGRYIVDIDFKAQFEIARASKQYCELLEILPATFVGKADVLKQILKMMSSAAKRSLKKQNLLLPPWRKQRYMQAKWFSSYKRTINEESQRSKRFEPLEFLTLRTPRFCLEFTKEMDMFHLRSQSKACQGNLNHGKREESLEALVGSHTAAKRAAEGFENNPNKSWIEPRAICTVTSTDWQLPLPIERTEDPCRDRISGLANALKEAGFCSGAPLQKPMKEPEAFLTSQQMLITVS